MLFVVGITLNTKSIESVAAHDPNQEGNDTGGTFLSLASSGMRLRPCVNQTGVLYTHMVMQVQILAGVKTMICSKAGRTWRTWYMHLCVMTDEHQIDRCKSKKLVLRGHVLCTCERDLRKFAAVDACASVDTELQ